MTRTRLFLEAVVIRRSKKFEADLEDSARSPGKPSRKRKRLPSPTAVSQPSTTSSRRRKVILDKSALIWSSPLDSERETDELVLPGEIAEDDDHDLANALTDGKPVRVLDQFVFYDARNLRMVPPDTIEHDPNIRVEAAGLVSACFEDDEVEGDEDYLYLEEMKYVVLGAIFRIWIDYTVEDGLIWVETQYSWYILGNPSEGYSVIYTQFVKPHRISQIVFSSAKEDPDEEYPSFIKRLELEFGWNECNLLESVPTIHQALDETEGTPVFSRALQQLVPRNFKKRNVSCNSRPPFRRADSSHVDPSKAVNPTHVTPLIAALADGLVREALQVVGPKPSSPGRASQQQQGDLPRLLANAREKERPTRYFDQDLLETEDDQCKYYSRVTVGQEVFSVGDVVLTLRHVKDSEKPVESYHILADHFWFAKIVYIKDDKKVHVRWFNHGSHFDIGELAHPYELYLDSTCGDIPLTVLAGKIHVHYMISSANEIPPNQFYVRYCTDSMTTGSTTTSPCVTSLDRAGLDLMTTLSCILPPDNCWVCVQRQDERENPEDQVKVISSGLIYRGQTFHLHDFVLYQSANGPAIIGQIVKIGGTDKRVDLKCVGRIRDIVGLPHEQMKDERHLFLTPAIETIEATKLVRTLSVYPFITIPKDCLDHWIGLSPYHFYIEYLFPSRQNPSWKDRSPLQSTLSMCRKCTDDKVKEFEISVDFVTRCESSRLPTLDLFGGCGAFGLGLAGGSQSLRITHAIEILPSSARTYERNSPDTKVYNQCVNVMLKYAIKKHSGLGVETPKQLFDRATDVPLPPKPGDVKVVLAGFPCQTFSGLNRYKGEGNRKSNLILNALSWIDFLKPDYCFLENVPGFVDEKLRVPIMQRPEHIQGRIEKGYFKLLLRALLDMGYQVRHGFLQAGQFGTPQSRLRFFLVAAKRGFKLPDLPHPTHFFGTNARSSSVAFLKDGLPHHFVTVGDAISDLPPFDWKDPDYHTLPDNLRREAEERERVIPSIECKAPRCGFDGAIAYHHPPLTRFQKQSREMPTTDLQHFTKALSEAHVRRTMQVALTPDGDYRDVRNSLCSFEMTNPCSAFARKGYISGGMYARLDLIGYFPTTVTNIGPTAKQGRVLHPFCKRMVTVRDLARSQGFPDNFVFVALDQHREIGNAVPFPLSMALGRELRKVLQEQWTQNHHDLTTGDCDDEI
ncbi:S-adenosyl-L-methionine-dependent methyltransferase [Marasmius fiardii PR-910]|nr:S-adenosyl-L-methionine-dependent methyltransferase [Marasmius fiardii PR-910]